MIVSNIICLCYAIGVNMRNARISRASHVINPTSRPPDHERTIFFCFINERCLQDRTAIWTAFDSQRSFHRREAVRVLLNSESLSFTIIFTIIFMYTPRVILMQSGIDERGLRFSYWIRIIVMETGSTFCVLFISVMKRSRETRINDWRFLVFIKRICVAGTK